MAIQFSAGDIVMQKCLAALKNNNIVLAHQILEIKK